MPIGPVLLSPTTLTGKLWPKAPVIHDTGLVVEAQLTAARGSTLAPARFTATAFHPSDTQQLCVGDTSGAVFLFNLQVNKFSLVGRLSDAVTSLCFVSDTVLAVGSGMAVALLSVAAGKVTARLRGPHTNAVRGIYVSPSAPAYVVTRSAETLALWHVSKGQCVQSSAGHYTDCSVAPNGDLVVLVGATVERRSFSTLEVLASATLSGHTLRCVAAGDSFVFAGTTTETALLLHHETLQPVWAVTMRGKGGTLSAHVAGPALFCAAHADGCVSVSAAQASDDGQLVVGQSLELRVPTTRCPASCSTADSHYGAVLGASTLQLYHLPSAKIAFDKLCAAAHPGDGSGLIMPFAGFRRSDTDHARGRREKEAAMDPAQPPPRDFDPDPEPLPMAPLPVPAADTVRGDWVKVNLLRSADDDDGRGAKGAKPATKPAAGPAAAKKAEPFESVAGLEAAIAMRSFLDRSTRVVNLEKLRATLLRFGSYPERYRALIWRFLLQLPERHVAQPQFAVLCAKGPHAGVTEQLKPFPLPPGRPRQLFERALTALAHHAPVFAVAHTVPAMVFPFTSVFGADVQSSVEVVLAFFLNWGREFFAFYPHMPVSITSFVSHTLKAEDPALWQHLTGAGLGPEVFVWEALGSLYSDVLTRNEWLQVFDHAFSNAPIWLFLFHVRWLCQIRLPLLALSDPAQLTAAFQRMTPFDINTVIQHTYRLVRTYSRNELSAPYEEYVLFPGGVYPTGFEVHESVVTARFEELEAIEMHERQLGGMARRTKDIERQLHDAAMLEDAFIARQRAMVAAKHDASQAQWGRRVTLEKERLRLRDIEQEARLGSVQEHLRTSQRLETLQEELHMAAAVEEQAATDRHQEAMKWDFADRMTRLEVERLEAAAQLKASNMLRSMDRDMAHPRGRVASEDPTDATPSPSKSPVQDRPASVTVDDPRPALTATPDLNLSAEPGPRDAPVPEPTVPSEPSVSAVERGTATETATDVPPAAAREDAAPALPPPAAPAAAAPAPSGWEAARRSPSDVTTATSGSGDAVDQMQRLHQKVRDEIEKARAEQASIAASLLSRMAKSDARPVVSTSDDSTDRAPLFRGNVPLRSDYPLPGHLASSPPNPPPRPVHPVHPSYDSAADIPADIETVSDDTFVTEQATHEASMMSTDASSVGHALLRPQPYGAPGYTATQR